VTLACGARRVRYKCWLLCAHIAAVCTRKLAALCVYWLLASVCVCDSKVHPGLYSRCAYVTVYSRSGPLTVSRPSLALWLGINMYV